MAKMLKVRAGENGPVFLPAPIQGQTQIGDEPIEVESTRFIRRRIEVGDLVLVDDDEDLGEEEDLTTPALPRATVSATFTPEGGVIPGATASDVHTSTETPTPPTSPAARRRSTLAGKE